MCDFSEVIQICVMMAGNTMPLLERVTISHHVIISYELLFMKLLSSSSNPNANKFSVQTLGLTDVDNLQSMFNPSEPNGLSLSIAILFFVALRCSLSHFDYDVAGILSQDVNGRPHSY